MPYTAFIRNSKGFTLLELMVVVSLIAIISGMTIPNFTNYINTQNLRQAQDQIKNDLQSMQSKALSGVNYGTGSNTNTYWGMKFIPTQNSYTSFVTNQPSSQLSSVCASPPTSPISEKSEEFQNDIIIKGSGEKCVFFSYDNGNAVFVGGGSGISVGYTGDTGSSCRGVTINSAGLVLLEDEYSCN